MGLLFLRTLPCVVSYHCICGVELASLEAEMSRCFTGLRGTAYLFNDVINTTSGDFKERRLRTGLFRVNDVYCVGCQQLLGRRFARICDQSGMAQEGKYFLEKKRIVKYTKNQDQPSAVEPHVNQQGEAQVTMEEEAQATDEEEAQENEEGEEHIAEEDAQYNVGEEHIVEEEAQDIAGDTHIVEESAQYNEEGEEHIVEEEAQNTGGDAHIVEESAEL